MDPRLRTNRRPPSTARPKPAAAGADTGPPSLPLRQALFRSRPVLIYTGLMIVPAAIVFAIIGGKTEMTKEELMETPTWARAKAASSGMKHGYGNKEDRAEREQRMNQVLFDSKGEFRHEWARKRQLAPGADGNANTAETPSR